MGAGTIMIILDLGSANICHNDRNTIRDMIQSISDVDTGRERVILKWQLFSDASIFKPLSHSCFEYAYRLAWDLGYETTASVYDDESLEYLQTHYEIPFIRIDCNTKFYPLMWHVNPEIDKYVSVDNPANKRGIIDMYEGMKMTFLNCIPKFLAYANDYLLFGDALKHSIVDNTVGLDMYRLHKPTIWEKHFNGVCGISAKELKVIL
jgi:hypothetical protein